MIVEKAFACDETNVELHQEISNLYHGTDICTQDLVGVPLTAHLLCLHGDS